MSKIRIGVGGAAFRLWSKQQLRVEVLSQYFNFLPLVKGYTRRTKVEHSTGSREWDGSGGKRGRKPLSWWQWWHSHPLDPALPPLGIWGEGEGEGSRWFQGPLYMNQKGRWRKKKWNHQREPLINWIKIKWKKKTLSQTQSTQTYPEALASYTKDQERMWYHLCIYCDNYCCWSFSPKGQS